MNRKASFASVAIALLTLSDEELSAVAEKPKLLKQFAGDLVAGIVANIYVVPLGDVDVPNQFVAAVTKWRYLAAVLGYTGPVAWKVRAGFALKTHAPLAGPCYDKLRYLQKWDLKNDESTKDSLVFWIPRLAPESTGKTIKQMETHRAELRKLYNLPGSHCQQFGSIALLFALILAHFKRTGERVPLNMFYAASDTLCAGGSRLLAGDFGSRGLGCSYECVSGRDDSVGCFLLGVEELGQ